MKEDIKNLDEAAQMAFQLIRDIQRVMESDNVYLQELAFEILETTHKTREKLIKLSKMAQ